MQKSNTPTGARGAAPPPPPPPPAPHDNGYDIAYASGVHTLTYSGLQGLQYPMTMQQHQNYQVGHNIPVIYGGAGGVSVGRYPHAHMPNAWRGTTYMNMLHYQQPHQQQQHQHYQQYPYQQQQYHQQQQQHIHVPFAQLPYVAGTAGVQPPAFTATTAVAAVVHQHLAPTPFGRRGGESKKPTQPTQLVPALSTVASSSIPTVDNENENEKEKEKEKEKDGEAHVQVTHRCEPCAKDFSSTDSFNAHTATHETCTHTGCAFNATKKVVSAHFHATHGDFSGTGYKDIDVEGQSFRVLLGTSPEEVEQWRAARRKKYPSATNVLTKLENNEKLNEAGGLVRGGVQSGKKRKLSSGSNPHSIRSKQQKDNETVNDTSSSGLVEAEGQTDTDLAVPAASGSEFVVEPVAKKRVCYNFSEGKCESGDACTFLHVAPTTCKFYLQSRCKQGARCRNLHGKNNVAAAYKDHENNPRNKKNGLFLPKPLAGGQRGTLLRKLLQDSIEDEENIILQAVRHFANQLRKVGSSSVIVGVDAGWGEGKEKKEE